MKSQITCWRIKVKVRKKTVENGNTFVAHGVNRGKDSN